MGQATDIPWREWSREAFEEARRTKKPILLDLSAVWCHWCHVMDQTSYSDDQVIDLITRDFIPVRVDIDRRPDIRDRYSVFGGWPTTAFLNHRGEIVTGATYIPPEQMRRVLPQVKDYFEKHQGDPPVQTRLREEETPAQPEGELAAGIVEEVLGHILIAFDEVHGGLGTQPKFPHPDPLDLVLALYHERGNRQFLNVATRTLDAMAAAGIHDAVEGGFFRYSVTPDWSVPHYEKMCDVNAGLLRNYLHAFAVTGNVRYREVAEDILRYVGRVQTDPEGGFYGSQDADEEYYRGGTPEARRSHPAPHVDRTLYADLNGMMAHAHLEARGLLGDRGAGDRAVAALRRILRTQVGPDGAVLHYPDPQAPRGLLADQAWMARALVSAYGITGEAEFVVGVEGLAGYALKELRGASGAFRDRPKSPDEIGFLVRDEEPIQENAIMADVLIRLAEVTGKDEYARAAGESLRAFADDFDRYGFFAAGYASVVDLHLRGPVKLAVIGLDGGAAATELHEEALRLYEPRKVVLPKGGLPGSKGFPRQPAPALYVCVKELCSSPMLPGPGLRGSIRQFVSGVLPAA